MTKIKLLSASEAAKKLGVHSKTVSRLMRLQKLDAVKVANRWLVDEASFEQFAKTYVGKEGRPKGWSPKRKGGK
jgi:excisionase family DNA binding protein